MVVNGVAVVLAQVEHASVAEGDQVYDAPPVAERFAGLPAQMDVSLLTDKLTAGCTATITWSVAVQPPPPVTVNVYVVETVGVATGLAIDVELNPVDGLHAYDGPPLPCSVVDCPAQMVMLLPAFAFGCGQTETLVIAVSEHPGPVATIVYVVEKAGDARTD